MNNVAFNYIPRPNLESIVIKRKGKVIKGETEQARTVALAEFRAQRNAAKRVRRRRRQAGYTLFELMTVLGFFAFWATIIFVISHFIVKFW